MEMHRHKCNEQNKGKLAKLALHKIALTGFSIRPIKLRFIDK